MGRLSTTECTYLPTLTNVCTRMLLIFDQIWFSSNIEFS